MKKVEKPCSTDLHILICLRHTTTYYTTPIVYYLQLPQNLAFSEELCFEELYAKGYVRESTTV
jgi:hypothetical protein